MSQPTPRPLVHTPTCYLNMPSNALSPPLGLTRAMSQPTPRPLAHTPTCYLNIPPNALLSTSGIHRAMPQPILRPLAHTPMLGRWLNPHREQQTIPQGQTSSPPKYVSTLTAKARPDQAALATSAEARRATHRARPRSPLLEHAAKRTLLDLLVLGPRLRNLKGALCA